MKSIFSSRGLFLLGLLLLLLTNVAILAGVAANRSGTPETQVVLTEREVQIPYRSHKENSGLALHLNWRISSVKDESGFSSRWNSPSWFDIAKLKELGFLIPDRDRSDDSYHKRKQSLSKEVFLVLENNSPLVQQIVRALELALEKEKKLHLADSDNKELIDRVKRAEERLRRERVSGSSLFVVDAGLDVKQLRGQYSDRAKFIITKGKVNYRYSYRGKGQEQEKQQEITGYVSSLSVANIHVPLNHRKKLDSIRERRKSRDKDDPPRYQVELAYGHRFEPWLVSIQEIAED